MGVMEQARARGLPDDATRSPYVCIYGMHCMETKLCKLPWTADSVRLPGSCSNLLYGGPVSPTWCFHEGYRMEGSPAVLR